MKKTSLVSREDLEDVLDEGRKVEAPGDGRLLRRERDVPEEPLVGASVDHGNPGSEALAVLPEEEECRRGVRDHEVRRSPTAEHAHVSDDGVLVDRLETLGFERDLEELDRRPVAPRQLGPDNRGDDAVG